jgi:hypothetical protein
LEVEKQIRTEKEELCKVVKCLFVGEGLKNKTKRRMSDITHRLTLLEALFVHPP